MVETENILFEPAEVHSVEETGLTQGLLVDLILKHIFVEGTVFLGTVMQRSKLSPPVVHNIYRYLQKEALVETRRMVGDDYEVVLTTKGAAAAEVAMKNSSYAGPAPVPLAAYNQAVSTQGLPVNVNVATLRQSLSDLVVSDQIIHQLGTALVTGGSIMLYGGTGNGKTSLGERLHRIFRDKVYIPYAVEASGQVITVYDPLVHNAAKHQPEIRDERWVLCQRPMVKVGGEMRTEMLEPAVDPVSRICVGPLQMKANNGILLIDDFGRQRISPRELLNRWIVPLDRRTDNVALLSGLSFEIPFEVLVIFATNLSLTDLAEEAFLRRLRNKIKVDAFTDDLFRELIRRVCEQRGMEVSPEIVDYLTERCQQRSPDGLRACYPFDITGIIEGMARFEQTTASMGKEQVDKALEVYFVH